MDIIRSWIPAFIMTLVLPLCVSCDKSIYNNLFTEMYTITYDGNGFTAGNPPDRSPFTYNVNDTVTVSGNTGDFRGPLIQDGITQRFIEWNTAANGTGTAYVAGDTFSMGDADITLYAQWTTTLSVITKTGPAGGFIFFDDSTDIYPGWRYMEAAPADQGMAEWGCSGTWIPGVQSDNLGDGYQNTLDILANCATPGIGARVCDDYSLTGYNDWYLPSYAEMVEMRVNLHNNGVGNFILNAEYWTSSETWVTPTDAHIISIDPSNHYWGGKSSLMNIRPARRF